MQVKIEVTKNHIRRGIQGDTSKCMLALAIQKHLKPGFVVVVGGMVQVFEGVDDGSTKSIIDWNKPRGLEVELPKKALKAMTCFDQEFKSKSKPMWFKLDLPKEVLRTVPTKRKDFVDEVVAERTRKSPGFGKLVKKARAKKK